jgi:hypothetical protein
MSSRIRCVCTWHLTNVCFLHSMTPCLANSAARGG